MPELIGLTMPASEKHLPCPTRERGHNGDAQCQRSGYPGGPWSGLLALQTGPQHSMSPGLSIECPVCDGRAGEPCITRAGKPTRTHVERVKAETTVTTGPDADPTPPASERIDLDAWLNRIHQGDALGLMKQMPDGCVDLVFTSPPYNLRNSTGGQGGKSPTR